MNDEQRTTDHERWQEEKCFTLRVDSSLEGTSANLRGEGDLSFVIPAPYLIRGRNDATTKLALRALEGEGGGAEQNGQIS